MVIDLFAAALIFLLIGSSIMSAWSNKEREAEARLVEEDMQMMAERAMETLTKTQGLPNTWETLKSQGNPEWEAGEIDQISIIGLAKRDRVLSLSKIDSFIELVGLIPYLEENAVYEISKEKLLVGNNDYYFRLMHASNGVEPLGIEVGKALPTGKAAERVEHVRITKPVTYGGVAAIAELTLFREIW